MNKDMGFFFILDFTLYTQFMALQFRCLSDAIAMTLVCLHRRDGIKLV